MVLMDFELMNGKSSLLDVEMKISRFLEKALKLSRAVDTEGLCILAGSHVICITLKTYRQFRFGGFIDENFAFFKLYFDAFIQ